MPQPTVAGRILDALAAHGVEQAFGLPGVHNLAFWRELRGGRPDITGVRHEQAAVYAADGTARATGRLGAALTTTGPGAANTLGAFGEAAASSSPVLVVASEVPERLRAPGAVRGMLHESRDQAGLFEPLAKAVFRPRSAEHAAAAVGEAITTALAWPRGPVYLDVPTDLLDAPAPEITPSAPERPVPAPAEISAAARLLDDAGTAVLWVGGGAVQSEAAQQVDALARRLRAPVVTTYSGRGILPSDHPWMIGLPPHEPEVAELIGGADVLVGIGTDFDGVHTRNWSMPLPPRLVSINVDSGELGKNYTPDVAVLGDAAAGIDALLPALTGSAGTGGPDVQQLRQATRERLHQDPRTTGAMALVDAIDRAWPQRGTLVTDMAVAGYWACGYTALSRPRQLQCPYGWGTLGYALPAALGPAAAGRGPVLAVCGDGGLLFGVGELATIVQEQLPVTVLVVDDGGYGMLRYDQQHAGDAERGVDLVGPDLAVLAESFGIESRVVAESGDDLVGALAEAAGSRKPRLITLRAAFLPPRTTSPRWHD
ncbi:thiamine pyrophosphate-binding protein [Salinifilum aidingensis]